MPFHHQRTAGKPVLFFPALQQFDAGVIDVGQFFDMHVQFFPEGLTFKNGNKPRQAQESGTSLQQKVNTSILSGNRRRSREDGAAFSF